MFIVVFLLGLYIWMGILFILKGAWCIGNFAPEERTVTLNHKPAYGLKRLLAYSVLALYLLLFWPHKVITSGWSFYD